MRTSSLALVAVVCFLVGGCVRTVAPILNNDQLQSNDAALGHWVSQPGTDRLDVKKSGDNYLATYVDKDGKQAPLDIRYGKIGKLIVAEVTAHDPGADKSDVYRVHLLPLYSFLILDETKPRLVFRTISPKWFKDYVKVHPAELAVINADSDSPIITASTADFQTFLLKHWDEPDVTGDPIIFVRPGDPTTKAAGQ